MNVFFSFFHFGLYFSCSCPGNLFLFLGLLAYANCMGRLIASPIMLARRYGATAQLPQSVSGHPKDSLSPDYSRYSARANNVQPHPPSHDAIECLSSTIIQSLIFGCLVTPGILYSLVLAKRGRTRWLHVVNYSSLWRRGWPAARRGARHVGGKVERRGWGDDSTFHRAWAERTQPLVVGPSYSGLQLGCDMSQHVLNYLVLVCIRCWPPCSLLW